MDLLTVDVTHLTNIPDRMEILCDLQTIDQLSDEAGTIGYEILTRNSKTLKLGTKTNLRNILTTLEAEQPGLAIIDSIQTLWADNIESVPGSISQVRAACHELVLFAKKNNVAIILVGHVTKDGQIAGLDKISADTVETAAVWSYSKLL